MRDKTTFPRPVNVNLHNRKSLGPGLGDLGINKNQKNLLILKSRQITSVSEYNHIAIAQVGKFGNQIDWDNLNLELPKIMLIQ